MKHYVNGELVDMTEDDVARQEEDRAIGRRFDELKFPRRVKEEASRRILDRFPLWKQNNMLARAIELQDIIRSAGEWTEEESSEADQLRSAWAWIKAVRDSSDKLEDEDPFGTVISDDSHWPSIE